MTTKHERSSARPLLFMLAALVSRDQGVVIDYLGGRAPKPQELRELVVRLARDNDGWGVAMILDVVRLLGHDIGRTPVRRILQGADLKPSPERLEHMPWATFLKAHWGAIAAMDFFQVEVVSLTGPVRYAVLVVMDLECITGYSMIEAESMEEAEKIARENPFVTAIRVYEVHNL